MKKWCGVWIFLMGMVLFLGKGLQVGATGEQGRVLFISSYSYGWDTVQLQIDGFIEGRTMSLWIPNGWILMWQGSCCMKG